MALPFPIINFGPFKINVVQTGALVNMSPVNIPVGVNSHNKTNRMGDNFGDVSCTSTLAPILVDQDIFDFLSSDSDLIV